MCQLYLNKTGRKNHYSRGKRLAIKKKKNPDKFCVSDFLNEGHIFNINGSWGHYRIKWENAFNTLGQYLAPRNLKKTLDIIFTMMMEFV